MNKIIRKDFYRITFKLKSPLALSSGENNYTDKDVIRDSRDKPYIPASSIAGVCRSALSELKKSDIDYYLGYVEKATEENKGESRSEESRLIFYDALLSSEDSIISVRDSVALDQYKTAKKGAKFDMEVVEPGVKFTSYIEYSKYEDDKSDGTIVSDILGLLASKQLSFGAKTMRGYGEIEEVSIKKASFDLSSGSGQRDYINFNMYERELWEPVDKFKIINVYKTLTLGLTLDGAISVRKYSTRPSTMKNHPEPDYEQLTLHDNTPVIPGTSWAGAFRHRMKELGLMDKEINHLFGWVRKKDSLKSVIRFSESQMSSSKEKILSRNAIDRFSGGTADGALFTERTWYGGETNLVITAAKSLSEREINALSAAISDLHYGYLMVGGLTSIGRGRFKVKTINGTEFNGEDIYKEVREVLKKWS